LISSQFEVIDKFIYFYINSKFTMNKSYKKTTLLVLIAFLFCIYLLGTYALDKPAASRQLPVDDWKYNASSSGEFGQQYGSGLGSYSRTSHFYNSDWFILTILILLLLLAILWLVLSIILIVKGSPINIDGITKTNPKRFLGIFLLSGPFILLGLIFIFGIIASLIDSIWLFIILTPLMLLAYLVIVVFYSIKNKAGILPIIALISLVLIISSFLFLIGFGRMGTFSKSADSLAAGGYQNAMSAPMGTVSNKAMAENIGFSTGGAKDVNNFRQNINHSYLPLSTDITYEGLFYDYYFDTGQTEECTKLFCPSYSYAISKDPLSKQDDYYLSVGLNSGIKESDFKRKKLNLVIVLDVSGSMSSSFDRYYYDRFSGQRIPFEEESGSDYNKRKIDIAEESVVGLIGHLNPDDRFGMVVYDSAAYLAKPLSLVGETDMEMIKSHIIEVEPRGGTYFEAGMKMGTGLFDDYKNANSDEYENRIIFLTDAMPNIGDTSETGLLGLTKKNADDKIYTTFIGMGVDFNTELIEAITKIRGANYYSVHSSKQFMTRMDDEFEYMVTPLVFNLQLNLESKGYQIEKVFGSPEANEATGEIMKVNTLFPSKTEGGMTKGGIIIIKLKKISSNANLKLKVSYEDRSGKSDSSVSEVQFTNSAPDYYENSGIRKAILLSRYASLVKNWITDERKALETQAKVVSSINEKTGIIIPPEPALNKWERQSVPLHISEQYQKIFTDFSVYYEKEASAIGDNSLEQELVLLKKLSSYTSMSDIPIY
jgi:Ca-activated chloride channel homolog